MNDVNQVVPLVKHFVNFGATLSKAAPKGKSDAVLDDFRVRLVAHFVHVVFGNNFVEARGRRLEVVEGVAHVAFGREDERLNASLVGLKLLELDDAVETPHHLSV